MVAYSTPVEKWVARTAQTSLIIVATQKTNVEEEEEMIQMTRKWQFSILPLHQVDTKDYKTQEEPLTTVMTLDQLDRNKYKNQLEMIFILRKISSAKGNRQ